MTSSYHDYGQAYEAARRRANNTGLDVVIRSVLEYGRRVYNVSFACRADSDYIRYEIVKPEYSRKDIFRD